MDKEEQIKSIDNERVKYYNMIDKVSIVSIIVSVLYVFILFVTL